LILIHEIYNIIIIYFGPSCFINTEAYTQNLHIEVYNKTGITLDSVQIDTFYLGRLMNDSSTLVKGLNEFQRSGPWPLLKVSAVDELGNSMKNLAKCGTKAVRVKEGHFAFDIIINTAGLNPRLELIIHQ